jgi:Ca2+-binding RTX toxin-like protein
MIISELAINSELALASYANLKLGDNVESDFRSNNSGVFSSLAASLADRYRVIAILDDTASGAYAAVFEDKLTGERTLAIRGTTDVNDIVADTYLLTGTPASLNPQYAALAARVMQWQAEGIVGASTTVVGHSLGGYLATALKSSADFTLGLAYTFNAPGLGSAAGTLGEFFQGAFNIGVLSSAVYDVRGSAGLSLIAGLGQHWGTAVPVEIEAAAGAGLGNHLIDKLTSSLAVMRMWSALDPTLTVDRANQLIAAASDTSASSLEKSVDATLRLLNGPSVAATIATGDVDALYANLLALTAQDAQGAYTHPAFSTLAGHLRIELSSAALANSARGDFSSLVSLIGLSPLVLSGADAAGQAALDAVLQGAWGDEFAQWQADREAVAAGLAASHHTDSWLSDRALLLQTVLGFNVSGEVSLAGLPTDRVLEFQWRDADNAARTLLAGGLIDEALVYFDLLPAQRVAFGGDAAEVLTGTDNELGDHLYAGGGNDTVQGLLGNDWLEGNTGDDRLDGGAGYDWLDGGAGADTLEGGEGLYYDTLEGGSGDDLYLVGANAGIDNITSSEAGDRLELNGRRIDGSGTLIAITGAVTIWQDRSQSGDSITYSLNAATHELSIRGANSTVVVKDFEASDLGISVPGDDAGAAAGTTVFADLSSGDYSGGWRDGGFDAPAGSAEHLINFNQAQPLAVPAFFTIDTRGGDDWIEGGTGISGVPLHITAGSGNDRVYAGLTQTLTQALATQDTMAASGRSDLLLDGGAGDDSVFGGASDDALFGGNGDDTLVGGAGRDVIFSDGDSGQRLAGWTEGITNQRWVAGDNTAGATLYFNGYARFGRIAYFSPGSAIEVTSETQFYNLKFGPDSIDFTPLSALQGVRLAPADYLPGWTVRADGRFDGSDSQLGTHDPQPGLYFNTNRYSGRDVVFAGAGNDLVNAGGGDDYVDAGSGNDVVRGYQGDDEIIGGTGNDNLLGDSYSVDSRPADVYLCAEFRTFVLDPAKPGQAHGNDFIDGGDGNDTLEGSGGADVLWGGRGNDLVFGDESRLPGEGLSGGDCIGNDVIDGGEGNDTALGGGGDDFISAGLGADTLYADNAFSDKLPFAGRSTAAGHDTLDGGAGNDSIFGEGGNDVLLGGDGNDQLEGDGATTLLRAALHGNDDIDGGAGNDSLWGGGGADVLRGGDGNDWLAGEDQRTTSASTTLFGHDSLWGGAGADTLLGGTGDDQLSGGADADMLYGGFGADTYIYNLGDGFDTIVDLGGYNDGADELRLGAGISADSLSLLRTGSDLVFTFGHAGDQLTLKNWVLGPTSAYQIEVIRFADGTVWTESETSDQAQQTRGTAGNDVLRGSDLYRDRVRGLGGNDTLSGSGFGDTLDGGEGDDLLDAGGNGRFNSHITYIGGKGNDTLIGSEYGDVYIFNLGDGVDTLIDHAVSGSDGEDELRFGEGIVSSDMTLSRLGDDMIFRHANGSDQITVVNWFFNPDKGDQIDQIVFEDITWSADEASLRGQPPIVGTPGDDRLIGTWTPERIIGGAGNDTLTGEGVHDQLEGGDGDDVLNAPSSNSTAPYYSGLTFIGGRGNDTIAGSVHDDVYVFNFGDGADTINEMPSSSFSGDELRFGTGMAEADITPIRSGWDVVFKHTNGVDQVTVKGWFDRDLSTYQVTTVSFNGGIQWTAAEITEGLLWKSSTGTSSEDLLIGTEAAETLLGLAGDDLLMAGGPGDRLEGGTGNDNLMGMFGSSAVTFVGGAGNDTVTGSYGYDLYLFNLGDGADTVTATNGGNDMTGGELAGGILRFGAGIAPRDITTRRDGNDLVLRHLNGADQVTLKSWFASATRSHQTDYVEFANGTRWSSDFLTQRLLRLSGTAGADVLVGTAFVDTLLGLAGDDTLTAVGSDDVLDGGAGNDTLTTQVTDYKFSNRQITFTGGRGNDTFFSWQSLRDVYHFKLGDGADTITDFDEGPYYNAVDELRLGTGIAAADISTLRAGNDLILRHSNRTDQITVTGWFTGVTMQIEQVSFIDGTVWLADQISQRALATGTPGDDLLTGTELANLIEGLAGNDTLDGGAGNDTLIGGTGDDTYVADSALDVLNEKASQGTDTVQSSLSWTLGANIENLTLTGTEASSGTGNTLANALRGNAQANLLSGLGGNDTLYGGAGADTLLGGAGDDSYIGGLGADTLNDTSTTTNDVYVWGRDQGADTLSDAGGIDRLDVLPGVTEDQLWLRRVGKNLELSVIGTADSLTINGWYASPGKQIESFHLSDGQALQAGRVQQLVDAMAAFAPPSAGQTSLPQPYQTALQPVIAPNWV